MKYNFITRASVESNSNKGHKTWLSVGIICLFIAMVLELIINQKFGLVFIVPIIYLINLRAHTSGKTTVKDVEIEMNFEHNELTLLYKNTILSKKTIYSQLFICPYNRVSNMEYNKANNTVYLLADVDMKIIDESHNVIRSKKIDNRRIDIFIPDYCFEQVLNSLKENVDVESNNI